MQEKMKALKKEFERIKKIGWIKERRKGFCSVGYTFEQMLGKEEEDFPIPDFDGIEIKTRNYHAKTHLHLFNLTPDGDYLFPIKRILDTLGCPSKDNHNNKVFYRNFNGSEYTQIIYGQKGILKVNRKEEKIDLVVYNHKDENINIGISWSFEWLKERLKLKLQYLAIVYASSCIISGEGYYHYDEINFYKLKDFDTFLLLVEKGLIEITFKIGVFKSGRRIGQVYDHGTDFSIDIDNIESLYDKIKIINY